MVLSGIRMVFLAESCAALNSPTLNCEFVGEGCSSSGNRLCVLLLQLFRYRLRAEVLIFRFIKLLFNNPEPDDNILTHAIVYFIADIPLHGRHFSLWPAFPVNELLHRLQSCWLSTFV